MSYLLDFESPIAEIELKIAELKRLSVASDLSLSQEIERLEEKLCLKLQEIYKSLTPWQTVSIARHPARPRTRDYISGIFEDFTPLAGDRTFAEDSAIMGGLARFRGQGVMVIGHEKGRDSAERIRCNFGMPRPEGYRKVKRLLELAGRFSLPVICLVDTPGAHPGPDAEERGQGEALASCIMTSLSLPVPIITLIIGEGGSGGAVALAVADHLCMLEYAVYSVISPEGCASILWRTAEKKAEAALAQRLTSKELLKFGLINQVIPEPLGGAHRNKHQMIDTVAGGLEKVLMRMSGKEGEYYINQRRQKFISMGRIQGKAIPSS